VTVYVHVLDYCHADQFVNYTANSRGGKKAAPDTPKTFSVLLLIIFNFGQTAREVLAIQDMDFVFVAHLPILNVL